MPSRDMKKTNVKLMKGWNNPTIVEVHPGTFTLAVDMDEAATHRWTEDDRVKLAKVARKFLENELGYKIITLKEYQKKHSK